MFEALAWKELQSKASVRECANRGIGKEGKVWGLFVNHVGPAFSNPAISDPYVQIVAGTNCSIIDVAVLNDNSCSEAVKNDRQLSKQIICRLRISRSSL